MRVADWDSCKGSRLICLPSSTESGLRNRFIDPPELFAPGAEDKGGVVAGNVLLSGLDPTGETVASFSAPAGRLSEWGTCGVA